LGEVAGGLGEVAVGGRKRSCILAGFKGHIPVASKAFVASCFSGEKVLSRAGNRKRRKFSFPIPEFAAQENLATSGE